MIVELHAVETCVRVGTRQFDTDDVSWWSEMNQWADYVVQFHGPVTGVFVSHGCETIMDRDPRIHTFKIIEGRDCYRWCIECGHTFWHGWELLAEHNKVVDQMNEFEACFGGPSAKHQVNPNKVTICPRCNHNF